jgi:hypothetical protein
LDESPTTDGPWTSILADSPSKQERYEGAIVLDQLVEEHPVEARG